METKTLYVVSVKHERMRTQLTTCHLFGACNTSEASVTKQSSTSALETPEMAGSTSGKGSLHESRVDNSTVREKTLSCQFKPTGKNQFIFFSSQIMFNRYGGGYGGGYGGYGGGFGGRGGGGGGFGNQFGGNQFGSGFIGGPGSGGMMGKYKQMLWVELLFAEYRRRKLKSSRGLLFQRLALAPVTEDLTNVLFCQAVMVDLVVGTSAILVVSDNREADSLGEILSNVEILSNRLADKLLPKNVSTR